ncbi:YbcC family protein [Arsenicibacter rosenii]|uniref:Probable inorganic carbon transporter subunit DabA n=1 Tax=Arsenicibacter rosenii TaxID=1750698 RepID=A0A1S2VRD2_9BACT|nr:DUF2309 domain-containing protein [Arsenicibacter rosenii]OIN60960.1 hypothetical protein BLX24_02430 [Arsenicibacter rosenii]
MTTRPAPFDEDEVLHELKHYLPAQAPLKDFIHHNTLHAFQHLPFYKAIQRASALFGYKVSLSLSEYRAAYAAGQIKETILEQKIRERKGEKALADWKDRLLHAPPDATTLPRIGQLRANWKRQYRIDLDSLVHPVLFRVLCSYLDQGISIWSFPVADQRFLSALREMEKNSFSSFFRTRRVRDLFIQGPCTITELLTQLVGDETWFAQYLYDQQFAHQGWSGMVSAIEDQPQTLLDQRQISVHDLIVFELLLEMDALDSQFGAGAWEPLARRLQDAPPALFADVNASGLDDMLTIWQEAYEWSYYEDVLTGLVANYGPKPAPAEKSFQALFCIDDRECSFRRYVEQFDPECETFGTPGFFNVEFFYKPQDGQYLTKLCPAPVTPKHLVKEADAKSARERDIHFTKHAHSFHSGWLISQTLGFWSAFRLFANIFRPTMTPATASSFKHMDKHARLTVEHGATDGFEDGLQIGFTVPEMVARVEGLLKSIGLVREFAPLIYVVGHGSSSVNNPHYAAYDCGACSGRAGSVNARVICSMANHPEVRAQLRERGIAIPDTTDFVGALHDTTRDEIMFYDEHKLSPVNQQRHSANEITFAKALDYNAKERSRRFASIDTRLSAKRIHELIKIRSVSLFEPRPELNHATNALCIVGKRDLTKGLFLDRRSFMNSYDYQIDPDGNYLFSILKAAAPVCGGINLEYFFSRVDNQKLGAGSKLPHNVMGLFGVANGIDGDLRPGLPVQMIEVHDPVRLLMIVQHKPEVVLKTIQRAPETYEWFNHEWVRLVVFHPETEALYLFKDGAFTPYTPAQGQLRTIQDITPLVETHQENLPVYALH